MVGVVDYGMGNLKSVYSAIEYIGSKVMICKYPEDLYEVDYVIIPGVGAIEQCILKLTETGFTQALNEVVLKKGKPTLGICLGMQVMCKISYENGENICLGWFDAEVIRLDPSVNTMKVPNIGWNKTELNQSVKLFDGLPSATDFYFVHSYYVCPEEDVTVGITDYGVKFTSVIEKENIMACQFHPEKSHEKGLQILKNFVEL